MSINIVRSANNSSRGFLADDAKAAGKGNGASPHTDTYRNRHGGSVLKKSRLRVDTQSFSLRFLRGGLGWGKYYPSLNFSVNPQENRIQMIDKSVPTDFELLSSKRISSSTKGYKRSSPSIMEVRDGSKLLRPCLATSGVNGNASSAAAEGDVQNRSDDSTRATSRPLLELKTDFETIARTKHSILNGQFLNLIYHRPNPDGSLVEHRKGKKRVIIEALTHLVLNDIGIELPQTAQDMLIALYDSTDDLLLLALANLGIVGGLQLPKSLEQSVVQLLETIDTGVVTDEMQLLAASLVMNRAIGIVPKELTSLLTHASGLLVKNSGTKETSLHLPALLCLRSYLRSTRVVEAKLPPEMFTGSGLVEKIRQKMMKHRPTPMSRECLSFLKVVSSSSHANLIRQLFKTDNNSTSDNEFYAFKDILHATAIKFPEETLEVCSKVFSVSPKNGIPLRLLTSVVDTLIESRGNPIIMDVIRFAFSCLEASALLVAFFGNLADEDSMPEQQKMVPLIEVYRTLKDDNNPRVIWPAAALRFVQHSLVKEALAEGSLHHYIDEAFRSGSREDRIIASLLLCPEQQSLRLPVDCETMTAELELPKAVSCGNCIMTEVKLTASEAACEAVTRSLTSALIRIRGQEELVTKMRAQVSQEALERNRRSSEAKVLQAQISVSEERIEELKNSLAQCEDRLTEQKKRNEETMTALKQSRRDLEKSRTEGEKKRAECQNLQRELMTTKEQLVTAKKKIDDLEVFKDKLNCLMGSFPSA